MLKTVGEIVLSSQVKLDTAVINCLANPNRKRSACTAPTDSLTATQEIFLWGYEELCCERRNKDIGSVGSWKDAAR